MAPKTVQHSPRGPKGPQEAGHVNAPSILFRSKTDFEAPKNKDGNIFRTDFDANENNKTAECCVPFLKQFYVFFVLRLG